MALRRRIADWRNRVWRLHRRDLLRLAGLGALSGINSGAVHAQDSEGDALSPQRIWASYFRDKSVWGYFDRHSIGPGEKLDLMLSTGPRNESVRGHVELFRIEPTSVNAGQRLVWRSPVVSVRRQSVLRTAAALGLDWSPTLTDIDSANWTPGYYSADFVEAETQRRDPQIAQIVVTNPRRSGRILLKLCTNTYQAYNSWGGHSLYPNDDEARGAMVSFDRPTGPAFFEYDVYLARWLEELGLRNGFAVDYASNFDVHRDGGIFTDYPVVAFGAHDEYWSKEEFDAVERRIFQDGKNTIFFGANTAYFQIRYADVNRPPGDHDRGRQMICFKSTNDPIARRTTAADGQMLVTARFRDGARRPETMLAGVAYQDWFPSDAPGVPYYVADTDSPLFEGTGYRGGDAAADVVGYEWDNRDPAADGRRLWDKARSANAEIPEHTIKVLFRGSAAGEKTPNGLAEAVYFEAASGAKVFSSGTIRWCWGLGKSGFEREAFKKFNENLVLLFLGR
jgi:hypothetical protein